MKKNDAKDTNEEKKVIETKMDLIILLESLEFRMKLQQYFEKERRDRSVMLSKLPAGSRLKTCSFSVLDSVGLLTPEKFADAYIRIIEKKSRLSLREREYVKNIVNGILWGILGEQALDKKEIEGGLLRSARNDGEYEGSKGEENEKK